MTTHSRQKCRTLNHNPAALLQARLAKNFTQRQLAALAGVSQPHLSQLENGVWGASEDLLKDLAAYCGVTTDSLRASQ